MFFFLSKTIYFFVMPIPLIITLVVVSYFIKQLAWKRKLRYIAFGLLLFVSNPYIANQVMNGWEGPPTPLADIEHHELAIVLTGITNRDKLPRDRVYYGRGVDRVLHTIQLYKQHKIDKILISGGSGKLINNQEDIKEAVELLQTFLLAGVPKEDILIESESRNTHESAQNCAKLIGSMNVKNVMLITSAFHMKRSLLCFRKEGISCTPFSTDFYSHDQLQGMNGYITPLPEAIVKWNKIIREIIGIIVYRIMGYA